MHRKAGTSVVTLEGLVGAHRLCGVDDVHDGDANGIRFKLGRHTYLVTEDENDGYRSSMQDIEVTQTPVVNAFKPIKVLASMSDEGHYGSCTILQFRDVKTGQVVLEVGTGNEDDYYPYFVGNFFPQRMAVNAKVQP